MRTGYDAFLVACAASCAVSWGVVAAFPPSWAPKPPEVRIEVIPRDQLRVIKYYEDRIYQERAEVRFDHWRGRVYRLPEGVSQ